MVGCLNQTTQEGDTVRLDQFPMEDFQALFILLVIVCRAKLLEMENVRPIIHLQLVVVHLVLGGMGLVVFNKNHVDRVFTRIIQENVKNLLLGEEIVRETRALCLQLGVETMLGGIMEHVLVDQQ